MSDMKCPFCGRKLEQYWYEDFECWYCPDVACKGYVMTATKDMWQELIRTRKALDCAVKSIKLDKEFAEYMRTELGRARKALEIAKDTIRHADWFFDGDYNVDAKTMHNEIKCVIKAITALKQKE